MSASLRAMGSQHGDTVETDIPARMDRLPWSRWHWLVVIALGITWILDGLEVTIVGAIGGVLTDKSTLHLSPSGVGFVGTAYLIGAVLGALFFSYLTDRLGRKNLFMITLLVYLLATVATAFSWNLWSFALFRVITGMGIGGEYAAINSAIDELIPARNRGWTDLAINGSWWIGTAVGSALSLVLLNPDIIAINLGWRLMFGLGAILGVAVLLIRRILPESPRWLMTHGRLDEADEVVTNIETEIKHENDIDTLPEPGESITIRSREPVGYITVAKQLFREYPTRTVLGLTLMSTQAFLYNAIFFTYALVLQHFYGVPSSSVGYYIFPFAVGNFLGPIILGRFFDSVGRRPMIAFTYIFSGVLLAITGWMFMNGMLTAVTQTLAWCVIFFFASAGASSGYLTVSEIFPLEIRAMAIAFFYAVGTGIGGMFAPFLFGILIQHSSTSVFFGDLLGAGLMVLGGVVELVWGVDAERRSLESIARPLSAVKDVVQRPAQRMRPQPRSA